MVADRRHTHIVLRTRKTNALAQIPLLPAAKKLLGKKGDGFVLLNSRGKPWSEDGLENRIVKAKKDAGIKKRLHDARGTFATNLRHAGYTRDQIADAMGWRSERVEDLLKVYVDRNAVVLRMRPKNGKGT